MSSGGYEAMANEALAVEAIVIADAGPLIHLDEF
jgi:hypothetical protein